MNDEIWQWEVALEGIEWLLNSTNGTIFETMMACLNSIICSLQKTRTFFIIEDKDRSVSGKIEPVSGSLKT